MTSLKKMKLVPIENEDKPNIEKESHLKKELSKEDELMNVIKSNLEDSVKKKIIKSLYSEEPKESSKIVVNKPIITSRKLLTPPKRRKQNESKPKKDPFDSIKWNPY